MNPLAMAGVEIRRILREHPALSAGNEVDLGPFGNLAAVRALRARYPNAGTLRTLIEREAADLVEIVMDLSPTGQPTVAVIVPLDSIVRRKGRQRGRERVEEGEREGERGI